MDKFYIEFGGDPSKDGEVYKRYCSRNVKFEGTLFSDEVVELVRLSDVDEASILEMEKKKGRVKELEFILRRIRNSIAVASWNVKPEFKKWASEVHQTIQAAHVEAEFYQNKIKELEEENAELQKYYNMAYNPPRPQGHIEIVEIITDPSEIFKYSVGSGGSGGSDGKK